MYGKDIQFGIYKLTDEYKNQINNFSCGNKSIDEYLKKDAFEHMQTGQSITKVVVKEDSNNIIAYYSLSASSIVIESYEGKYFSPAVEVKMFAVLDELHSLNYSEDEDEGTFSEHLFSLIIRDIYELSENTIGISSIILYSVPKAFNFYYGMGFKSFEEYMITSDSRYLNGCKPMWFEL